MWGKDFGITELDIERRISQGFGLGEGVKYLPWVRKHDFGSKGTAKEVFGVKILRSHHLLSQLEYYVFLYFEPVRHVLDIREQFPLLDRALVAHIIRKMGCRPPYYRGTRTPFVMSTDFLITILTNYGPVLFAFAVKPAEELKERRVRELLEIERRYWNAYKIPWALITEKEINRNKWLNLRWLRQSAILNKKLLSKDLNLAFLSMLGFVAKNEVSLGQMLRMIASQLSIDRSDAVALFKYNAWHGHISFNHHSRIKLTHCIDGLEVRESNLSIPFIEGGSSYDSSQLYICTC